MTPYDVIANDRYNLNRSIRKECLNRESAQAFARTFSAGYQVAIVEHRNGSRW
ncbi:MAG: hypothetical protein IJZ62_05135 [Clostridia bacterium]|nr:hypothetical protein [Clostridia bacterium]